MEKVTVSPLAAHQLGMAAALIHALLGALLILVTVPCFSTQVPEISLHPWFYLLVSCGGMYWLVYGLLRGLSPREVECPDSPRANNSLISRQFERLQLTTDLILESSTQGIFGMDPRGRVTFVNPAMCRMLGFGETELVNRDFHELLSHCDADGGVLPSMRSGLEEGTAGRGEDCYRCKDGGSLPVEFVCSPLNEGGDLLGVVVFFIDISERKRVQEQQHLAAKVFESVLEGLMITDAQARIVAVNPGFSGITGYSREEAIGQHPSMLKSDRHEPRFYRDMWHRVEQDGHWSGEIWNRHKGGSVYLEWLNITRVCDHRGKVTHYVGSFTDTSALKATEQKLHHLAHHDVLTGLPNRVLFKDRLDQALRRARREDCPVAILFLDLDHFKHVNDSLGHPVGDQLLCQVATRLQGLLRKGDTVARHGGDEFIILMDRLDEPGDAAVVACKLEAALSAPFNVSGRELFAGASIGISLYPRDGLDADTLVKNADASMYRAKELGRNNHQFYTRDMTLAADERLQLESELRHALERDQLSLHFQPQINLCTNTATGAEVLLRWNHPELGSIPPERFIRIAEETGLILPIGEWVLRTSCRLFAAWMQDERAPGRLSVNLSGAQIRRANIVETVREALQETGLPPHCLELEITEGFIMGKPEHSIETLGRLKALGVWLSIDDFGTGYSSLSYLRLLPIDRLKIDRSFLLGVPDDVNNGAIVAAIVALAHSLQLPVVAEGVETEAQREFLEDLGCEQAQGYLYGRPLCETDYLKYLGIPLS